MKGYITVVSRRANAYRAEVLDIPSCVFLAATVEEALHGAKESLRRWTEAGNDLPSPRPSHHMIKEVEQRSAIAGACLRGSRAA